MTANASLIVVFLNWNGACTGIKTMLAFQWSRQNRGFYNILRFFIASRIPLQSSGWLIAGWKLVEALHNNRRINFGGIPDR